MNVRFDFEQSILDCWHVTDDLDVLLKYICDHPEAAGTPPKVMDKVANITIGLKDLYQLKFEKCFELFEEMCKEMSQQKEAERLQTSSSTVLNEYTNQSVTNFLNRLTSPEGYGLAISEEVRKEAMRLKAQLSMSTQ